MRLLIVRNQDNAFTADAVYSLIAFLDAQGLEHTIINAEQLFGIQAREELRVKWKEPFDLAIVLGGDGTIIRTASFLHGSATPLLGINFGHLGFLANDSEEGVIELVMRALAGELYASRRSCLDVTATYEDDQDDLRLFAVNEASITRGVSGSMLEFAFDISDVRMADLSGDGLIVASATGSTAYSLAAGGPLVTPAFSGMVIQPLAPHTLVSRAILADSNDVVEITFKRPEDKSACALFVDGDAANVTGSVSSIRIQRAQDHIELLYAHQDHFLRYASRKFYRTEKD